MAKFNHHIGGKTRTFEYKNRELRAIEKRFGGASVLDLLQERLTSMDFLAETLSIGHLKVDKKAHANEVSKWLDDVEDITPLLEQLADTLTNALPFKLDDEEVSEGSPEKK